MLTVIGLWGYVVPYLIASRWMEIIMAGTSINKDDSYRVAKILALDAYAFTWIYIVLGVLLMGIGFIDNRRQRKVSPQ